MTQRRQVGFIRSYSNKNIHFQDEPSQFSYFKIRGGKDGDEFSPYKFEEKSPKNIMETLHPKPIPAKPPLPQRTLKNKISSYLHGKAEAEEYYEKIKQKIASYEEKQSSSKQKLQQNIGSIRNKIERLDEVLKDLKSKKQSSSQKRPISQKKKSIKNQKESSSSSSEQEVIIKAIPSPKMVNDSSKISSKQRISSQKSKQRSQFRDTQTKGANFIENEEGLYQSSRQNQNSLSKQKNEHNENVITFNSRIKNQPPLYIKSYSSSSSSDTQKRERIQQKNYLELQNKVARQNVRNKQIFKNRGGVCFEVDVKQFTAPVLSDKRERNRQIRPKKEKVDKKAEILKRRETAKAYDKKTRKAIFSPN